MGDVALELALFARVLNNAESLQATAATATATKSAKAPSRENELQANWGALWQANMTLPSRKRGKAREQAR